MNINQLQKHYDKLGDLERLRLAMAAQARGDDREFAALRDTARKATYSMTAWPYAGMANGVQMVAWIAVTDVLSAGFRLATTWGLGLAQSGGLCESESDLDHGLTAWDLAESVRAAWDGLQLFCDDVGLEFAHLLQQAPAADTASDVVEFASGLLETKETVLNAGAAALASEAGGDCDQAKRDSQAARALTRQKRARFYADQLGQVWKLETQ